jgi:DNA-3-methyladenine glycosylase I
MSDTAEPPPPPPPAAAGPPAASRPDLVVDADGRSRCAWGTGDPLYASYHDDEWGRPLRDERRLFELLCLEAFQSGLSWLTILRKRPAFRAAFEGFDPERVAAYGEPDIARLMSDEGIVRNRAKIDAAIANARGVVGLHEAGATLVEVVFGHVPPPDERPSAGRFAALGEIPSATPSSRALAADLRGRGFRFVGPVVAYALMQAGGVVDDHLAGCWVADAADGADAVDAR